MRQNRPLFSTWIEQRANKLRTGIFTTTSISFTVVARPSSLVDGYRRLLHKIWRDLFRQAPRQTRRNKFFIDHREPLLLQLARLPSQNIQYGIKLFAKERRARGLTKRKWKSSPFPLPSPVRLFSSSLYFRRRRTVDEAFRVEMDLVGAARFNSFNASCSC